MYRIVLGHQGSLARHECLCHLEGHMMVMMNGLQHTEIMFMIG